MNWFQRIRIKLKEQLKIVASNPENFEERWSFSSSRIQVFSLGIIIFIVSGLLFTLIVSYGPFSGFVSKNDTSIERKKLEKQHKQIELLTHQIESQENYIQHVSEVISGNIPVDSLPSEVPDAQKVIMPRLNSKPTKSEKAIAEKVKDDVRTDPRSATIKKNITYFCSPVKGKVVTPFNLLDHPAIDIVTAEDMTIKACLAGTVVYSGFTQKEGFILIIEHVNGYLSVYKNMKTVLKKSGTKVQTGDPIAIVGTTGEKLNKPHLHFELWYNQTAVNPFDYVSFD